MIRRITKTVFLIDGVFIGFTLNTYERMPRLEVLTNPTYITNGDFWENGWALIGSYPCPADLDIDEFADFIWQEIPEGSGGKDLHALITNYLQEVSRV